MGLWPGATYLLSLIPYFALPSAAVYLSFNLGRNFLELSVPQWLVVTSTVLARPALVFVKWQYVKTANKRAAAALGAVLPPTVADSPITVVKKGLSSMKNDFPGEMVKRWAKEYGNSFFIDLFTSSSFMTVEPHHVKAMLATQFDSFDKGSVFVGQMNALLGTGVFNSDGEMWKFHRSMTRPFFTRERVNDFDIYDRNSALSLKAASVRLAEGYSIDFQDLVGRFTLDSATEFLFGNNVGSLSAGIPYPAMAATKTPTSFYEHPSNKFVSAFIEGQIDSAARIASGHEWPLMEFFKDKVKPYRKIMDRFTEPLIGQALKKVEADVKDGADTNEVEELTLLAHLVKTTQDMKILKDELVNLLVAGRDTTMCLLTYSMYMLAEHPDIERRLRQEIFEIVGPTARPDYENIRDMRYMRAFLNEVLRLYPPVPGNVRTTNQAVVLPAANANEKPIYLPANTTCIYTVVNIHRRTDLWGPDALTFDPDRFIDERLQKYFIPNPYIFCPFNAGPRICLGQQFAYQEATFYLVRLLQQFTDFKLDETINAKPPPTYSSTEKVHSMSHLTLCVQGGLWVHVTDLRTPKS